jgi:hypothetical protein
VHILYQYVRVWAGAHCVRQLRTGATPKVSGTPRTLGLIALRNYTLCYRKLCFGLKVDSRPMCHKKIDEAKVNTNKAAYLNRNKNHAGLLGFYRTFGLDVLNTRQ